MEVMNAARITRDVTASFFGCTKYSASDVHRVCLRFPFLRTYQHRPPSVAGSSNEDGAGALYQVCSRVGLNIPGRVG